MADVARQPTLQDVIDENIRRNVDQLLRHRQVRRAHVQQVLGLSRQTLSDRVRGAARFTAAEVIILSHMLDVPAAELGEAPELVAERLMGRVPVPPVPLSEQLASLVAMQKQGCVSVQDAQVATVTALPTDAEKALERAERAEARPRHPSARPAAAGVEWGGKRRKAVS